MDVCYSFDKPTCKWDLHPCPGRDLSSRLLPLPSLRVEFRDQKERWYTCSKMLAAVMRPHLSLGPRELEVSPEDSGCAPIPRTICAQRWVTSLRLDPPCPHLFLVSHKHLSVLPAKHAGCHLPPAAASPAWTLLPPSAPGAWSAVLPTGGRSLPAVASTTTSLPPRHSHGSSLRTSETYPPPRAPRSPPHLGTPLSTPRSCCSFHDGNASTAALAPQLFWQNCDAPLIYI